MKYSPVKLFWEPRPGICIPVRATRHAKEMLKTGVPEFDSLSVWTRTLDSIFPENPYELMIRLLVTVRCNVYQQKKYPKQHTDADKQYDDYRKLFLGATKKELEQDGQPRRTHDRHRALTLAEFRDVFHEIADNAELADLNDMLSPAYRNYIPDVYEWCNAWKKLFDCEGRIVDTPDSDDKTIEQRIDAVLERTPVTALVPAAKVAAEPPVRAEVQIMDEQSMADVILPEARPPRIEVALEPTFTMLFEASEQQLKACLELIKASDADSEYYSSCEVNGNIVTLPLHAPVSTEYDVNRDLAHLQIDRVSDVAERLRNGIFELLRFVSRKDK